MSLRSHSDDDDLSLLEDSPTPVNTSITLLPSTPSSANNSPKELSPQAENSPITPNSITSHFIDEQAVIELWIALDLEFTSVDPKRSQIIEFAAQIIDPASPQLQTIGTPLHLMIRHHHYDFDDPVLYIHMSNGLIYDLKNLRLNFDPHGTLDQTIVDWLDSQVPAWAHGMRVIYKLVGFSVHHDLLHLRAHCPRFSAKLHHAVIDVSTLRTMFKISGLSPSKPQGSHRADADVAASLEQLRLYRTLIETATKIEIEHSSASSSPPSSSSPSSQTKSSIQTTKQTIEYRWGMPPPSHASTMNSMPYFFAAQQATLPRRENMQSFTTGKPQISRPSLSPQPIPASTTMAAKKPGSSKISKPAGTKF